VFGFHPHEILCGTPWPLGCNTPSINEDSGDGRRGLYRIPPAGASHRPRATTSRSSTTSTTTTIPRSSGATCQERLPAPREGHPRGGGPRRTREARRAGPPRGARGRTALAEPARALRIGERRRDARPARGVPPDRRPAVRLRVELVRLRQRARAVPRGQRNLQPISFYGATKLLGEHYVRIYARRYGIQSTCLRFFTAYGPRQRPDMAIHAFTAAIARTARSRCSATGRPSATTRSSRHRPGPAGRDRPPEPFAIFNLGESRTIELRKLIDLIGRNARQDAEDQADARAARRREADVRVDRRGAPPAGATIPRWGSKRGSGEIRRPGIRCLFKNNARVGVLSPAVPVEVSLIMISGSQARLSLSIEPPRPGCDVQIRVKHTIESEGDDDDFEDEASRISSRSRRSGHILVPPVRLRDVWRFDRCPKCGDYVTPGQPSVVRRHALVDVGDHDPDRALAPARACRSFR
jgi:hypothetical protein